MKGTVEVIKENNNGLEYGFIRLESGESVYFDSRSLNSEDKMSDFYKGDKVEIDTIIERLPGKKAAVGVHILGTDVEAAESQPLSQHPVKEFYTPGYYRSIDRNRMKKEHLKPNSKEYEILEKLKDVLYISHIGHHEMGVGGASFPFCLIGTTAFLKPFLHGMNEFLLVSEIIQYLNFVCRLTN